MTFKDITVLALLLVVGLVFNRCAFEGDALGERQVKHIERIVADIEGDIEELGERMEEFGEHMGKAGEEFGEQMGEFGESIGESFEDSGDETKADITLHSGDGNGAGKRAKTVELRITSQLDAPVEIDLALDVPAICNETALDFGHARKGELGVRASGNGELKPPGISPVDSETIALAFYGEAPSALTLELPRNVPYVRFEKPQQVKLALSEGALLMKLDAARVGSISVARSKKALTITHADWKLTITGISQPLALMSLEGETLGRVESNKRGEVEFDFANGKEGGAK